MKWISFCQERLCSRRFEMLACLTACLHMGGALRDDTNYSWFSHDVTKIQAKKLSFLLSFYFHVVLQHLKTFTQTKFRFKTVLRFATLGQIA